MVRILTVDDSPTIALFLKLILTKEVDFEIVGHANNGLEAVQLARLLRPDIIIMDVNMPIMDGLEATCIILQERAVPILIFSALVDDPKLKISFRAIEKGALAILGKPTNITDSHFNEFKKELITLIRGLAKVVNVETKIKFNQMNLSLKAPKEYVFKKEKKYEVVVLGASIGGPLALQTILSSLPENFPLPILLVQHMMSGFIDAFAEWMQKFSLLKIQIASDRAVLKPSTVYIAPADCQMKILRYSGNLSIKLEKSGLHEEPRPSIDFLFGSVANTCPGAAIGGLLTGMGNDGSQGLLDMYDHHCFTFVEDIKDCVMSSMVESAIKIRAVQKITPLNEVSEMLLKLL
ncbi:MAG: chemotaxis-specific protein-glutamate methyltransferase CheB [Gammaproteobacteria bacterium]|nr:chemotaxis-specific protein-glutamate methyltransferase CheB [Gammaproteobacteria bacterium]MBU2545761.1 chemotaxis-specific protein-glutamate methyltransferase CheB [Gammaproteobacteria bacterium]